MGWWGGCRVLRSADTRHVEVGDDDGMSISAAAVEGAHRDTARPQRQVDMASSGNPLAGLSMSMSGFFFCLFFFQAEDGIRDVAVTGVQTCALPISIFRIEIPGACCIDAPPIDHAIAPQLPTEGARQNDRFIVEGGEGNLGCRGEITDDILGPQRNFLAAHGLPFSNGSLNSTDQRHRILLA